MPIVMLQIISKKRLITSCLSQNSHPEVILSHKTVSAKRLSFAAPKNNWFTGNKTVLSVLHDVYTVVPKVYTLSCVRAKQCSPSSHSFCLSWYGSQGQEPNRTPKPHSPAYLKWFEMHCPWVCPRHYVISPVGVVTGSSKLMLVHVQHCKSQITL